MNMTLSAIEQWMSVNKLKMGKEGENEIHDKSVRKEQSNVILRCSDGTQIELMKYLHIIIDDKLQFKAITCDYVLKKIGKESFLDWIDNFVSAYTRCIMYKSIIAFHFEYCATLIINMSETQFMLQKTQNRTMRVIL